MGLQENVARQIKKARVEAGFTQGDLADYLGVTRPLITSIENGHTAPTLRHLEQLPKILGKPLGYFFDLDVDPESTPPREIEILAIFRSYHSDLTRDSLLSIARTLRQSDRDAYG